MKHKIYILFIGLWLAFPGKSQNIHQKIYSLGQVFDLTLKNNQSLKLSGNTLEIAKKQMEIAKLQRLPVADVSLTGGYLGNVLVIDKDFSNTSHVPMPHFANTFALQASQLIFKGDVVNNSIASAVLQEQVAALNLKGDKLDIKFLVTGYYFDLYKLYNQRKIYERNIELAQLRLQQIKKFYDKGMVTRNDIIRSELQIADLKLVLQNINNHINITNKQLITACGLPDSISIMPDTTILDKEPVLLSLNDYQDIAKNEYPDIQSAMLGINIADKKLAITKASRLPALTAYARNNLQRPITSSSPAIDKYSNGWQAGLTLSFDIGSIYNAPKNIQLRQLEINKAKETAVLVKQEKEIKVHAGYIDYQQALTQEKTLENNVRLANENYRITEKKYLNQLAVLVDMLDASNAKLEAELQQTNAAINVWYTYYHLQTEIGTL